MEDRSKYLAKNVGILTISNFASKILVFLLVPLYTSVLSTEDVGVYDLVISTLTLAFPLLTLNIIDAVMRFLLDKNVIKSEVASIGFKFLLLSFVPVSAFLVAVDNLDILNSIHGYELLIFIYYICSSFNQYLIQFAKGIELVSSLAIAGVIGTVSMLSSNILLLLVFKAGLQGFFIANILGQAIPALFLFIRTKLWTFISFKNINRVLQKEMLVYCVPLIATAIGWWVNTASDKYVVSFVCGVAANGILSVSYKIPAIINTFQSIFIQAWQISAVKEYGEDKTAQFYGKTFIALNAFMAIICSGLILLSKPAGHLLYKNEFYIAWQYVPFLLISNVINSASGFLGPILSAKKASKPMAMSAVYGASVNVVLNILLVYLIGIQGATIATVISSFIIYQVRKKAVGNDIVIEKYNRVLVTWAMLCIQAIFEIYTPFWWAECMIVCAIILININDIVELIKKITTILFKRRRDR